ncbi:MAG TPA: DUF6314 family protein [Nocardioides sp.]|nr:DUF6314 family protein [Nocardioides sp.]
MTPLDLLGTWELRRVVDDHRNGERRDVRGTATLELETPDRVRWDEEGTMTWAGHAVPVSRTLFVVRSGEAWWVEFEDGRPFHPWAVGERVRHDCAPDLYTGLIRLDQDPVEDPVERWTVEWRATGPEKDYVMTTVLSGRRPPHHPG